MNSPHHKRHAGLRGLLARAASTLLGAAMGCILALIVPPAFVDGHPEVAWWLTIPFGVLLASIAVLPFAAKTLWHKHYPDISLLLGAIVAAYYLAGFTLTTPGHTVSYGAEKVLHSVEEFYSFIALVGGLYVVSGAIFVEVRGRGTPLSNTLLLAVGAVIANIVGTTGASMLLIRPFMRLNKGRLRPLHVVFFIFIVSNCGGCLTPIGDPPLYLGFLKGVPFDWTLRNLWSDWVFTVGALLAVFYFVDRRLGPVKTDPANDPPESGVRIRGTVGLTCLGLMLLGVFIPVMLRQWARMDGQTIGATFQLLVAAAAFWLAPKATLKHNDFTFGPVKEVGLLFAGIFLTMIPALGYLAAHGAGLGIKSPVGYYFRTGVLSAVLDNAPTYLSFLQVAFGPGEVDAAGVSRFLSTRSGVITLDAISTGAVFFGAMTYLGNGPNFMVKAIAEGAGVRMPGFFGYLGWACLILLPILVVHAVIFIR